MLAFVSWIGDRSEGLYKRPGEVYIWNRAFRLTKHSKESERLRLCVVTEPGLSQDEYGKTPNM